MKNGIKLQYTWIGWLVLFAVIGSVFGGAFAIWNKSRYTVHNLNVYFERIGSLTPENPVYLNGVRVGTVVSITRDSVGTKVRLNFKEPQFLHEGVKIINHTHSLVGERVIIIYDTLGTPVIHPDSSVQGIFQPGITEGIHQVYKIINLVQKLQEIIVNLENPSEGEAFTHSFQNLIVNMETLTANLEKGVASSVPKLLNGINQTTKLSKNVVEISDSTEQVIQRLHKSTLNLYANLNTVSEKLVEVIGATHDVVDSVENNRIYELATGSNSVIQMLTEANVVLKKHVKALFDGDLVPRDPNSEGVIGWQNFKFFQKSYGEKLREKNEK